MIYTKVPDLGVCGRAMLLFCAHALFLQKGATGIHAKEAIIGKRLPVPLQQGRMGPQRAKRTTILPILRFRVFVPIVNDSRDPRDEDTALGFSGAEWGKMFPGCACSNGFSQAAACI